MFVHPAQVAKVAERHGEIGRARLVVERLGSRDQMTLLCESAQGGDGLAAAIEDSLRAITGLRGSVTLVAPGALANDGKVIDDRRPVD
jgi:phenylacetate-CoA ligase